jgi:hypothetical protein
VRVFVFVHFVTLLLTLLWWRFLHSHTRNISFRIVPKIIKTAASPSTDQPPKIDNAKSKEINQMESVL